MTTRPTFMKPKIDYTDAKRSWFVYGNTVYSVCLAPTNVFRAAVLRKAPKWKCCEEYEPILNQLTIDQNERWWLLNCLADARKGMTLYQSREAAMQAVSA